MKLNLDRVRVNVHRASTEDLLDRATVYRAGMEPEALQLIEEELYTRAITPAQIEAHAEQRRQETKSLPDGTVATCSFCHQPAVAEGRAWHKLWGIVPVFPRLLRYCSEHRPDGPSPASSLDAVTREDSPHQPE